MCVFFDEMITSSFCQTGVELLMSREGDSSVAIATSKDNLLNPNRLSKIKKKNLCKVTSVHQ